MFTNDFNQFEMLMLDNTAKRNSMSIAMNIIRSCRYKNVIYSSGANSEMQLRYPLDIVNLGHVLGFENAAASHDCFTKNAKSVLFHARKWMDLISLMIFNFKPCSFHSG